MSERAGAPPADGPARRARIPLLDRLLDAPSGMPASASDSASATLEILRSAVRRDLEALLNARRARRPLPAGLAQLPDSIANYGIPDPTAGMYALPEYREALVRELEATIRRFEPRLKDVKVTIIESDEPLQRELRMHVDAVLRADPIEQHLSFETRLEPVTREVTVREV
jgi:type VI secretion system protein ImpF